MNASVTEPYRRMLDVIEAAQKGETSLLTAADTLNFLLASINPQARPWADKIGSNILTLESAGIATQGQREAMGEKFNDLRRETLRDLAALVNVELERVGYSPEQE
ncbi:MAG: hypothetical protein AAF725_16885 [Acidobacteriota bacterium]